MDSFPYAQFRFNGQIVKMTKAMFEQALRDSRHCKCNSCLICRVREYYEETKGVNYEK